MTLTKNFSKIKVGMLSLGCPKTLVDSELVLGGLDRSKYDLAPSIADCDIAFLNTCAFIEDSKKESVNRILELIELKTEGRIQALVVLGCLYQRYPEALPKEFKEVNAFLGTGEYARVGEIVEKLSDEIVERKKQGGFRKKKSYEPFTAIGKPGFLYHAGNSRVALTPYHFRYLKISEGCDHHCTFCTIPSFRGKHRSRPMEDIFDEAKELAKLGCKEIVLTGQDTTHYGKDHSGQFLLPELLSGLSEIDGIEWVRVLYAYPLFVNDRLIEAIASTPKVCHYLDMPLQHINDEILQSMKRGVGKDRTIALIKRFRNRIPDLAIRTTFIVGYPGETEKQFEELLQFMEEIKFERLGVFTYSQEENTPAALLPKQVAPKVMRKRLEKAMLLQQKISYNNHQNYIGKTLQVLIDECDSKQKNTFVGRSYMDAPDIDGTVFVKTEKILKPGDFITVKVTQANEYDLTAVPAV